MICAVIVGPSEEEVRQQIQFSLDYADFVELRLDLFKEKSPNFLKNLLIGFSIPMIFTLRSINQGGQYEGTLEEYLAELEKLLSCKPHYLDIEFRAAKFFRRKDFMKQRL